MAELIRSIRNSWRFSGAASNFGNQTIGQIHQGQQIKNTITLRPGLPIAIMFPRRVVFDRAYPG